MTTLLIRDELTTGDVFNEFVLEVPSERLTAKELIQRRVQSEVAKHNTSRPEYFKGLVQPKEAERTLNGYRLRRRRKIDWREQAAVAIQMFHANGFILIVDGKQVEELATEIVVRPDTRVSFLKLMPLVGG
jgi:hypothetical protein